MGNFMEVLENAKTTATEQFENISQMVQEKLPTIKDSIQDTIPVIKNKFDDTVDLCKSKFIPKEDRAEIYALYSNPEEKNVNEENENENEENDFPFNQAKKSYYKSKSQSLNGYQQNETENAPRVYDEKDYMRELIDICNENGEVPPYEDFNQNGWEHFYSADDNFFLWDKGQVIPNRIKVTNPHDYKKLEIYQGDMTTDLMTRHGFGILTTPFFVRIGQWRWGQFTGWGRECRRNGEVLEGRFTNGRVNGKGIFITSKGNKYVGDIINNRLHGKGKLTTKSVQYSGEFKNNKMDGMGKILFNNGHKYEGEFRDNEIYGKGKFTWQNGDVYEGIMANGKMNGYGKYTYASNGQIYEGQFVNGVKRGDGKITYPSGKIYEGKFVNGVPQGQGVITENGESIPVVFQNGKAHEFRYD
jgi:hypothetical protein